jgi:hypothetical protein
MAGQQRCYAYSPVRLPGHNVCWYAGCLGFHGEGTGFFDTSFADEDAFAEKLALVNRDIDGYIASDRRGAEWLCLFVCHPTRAVHTDFWDAVNFDGGANPPADTWKPAPALDSALIPTVKASFRRLCEWLRDDSRLEVVGLSDLAQRYSTQAPGASRDEVLDFARTVAASGCVAFDERFTAAEWLLMMCAAAATPSARYSRRPALGPLRSPAPDERASVASGDVRAAARLVAEAAEGGYLPHAVTVAGQSVGIGTFYVLLARVLDGDAQPVATPVAPWPIEADGIAVEVERTIRGWRIHPPDMNLANILEQTRLQCWSLKPAGYW